MEMKLSNGYRCLAIPLLVTKGCKYFHQISISMVLRFFSDTKVIVNCVLMICNGSGYHYVSLHSKFQAFEHVQLISDLPNWISYFKIVCQFLTLRLFILKVLIKYAFYCIFFNQDVQVWEGDQVMFIHELEVVVQNLPQLRNLIISPCNIIRILDNNLFVSKYIHGNVTS